MIEYVDANGVTQFNADGTMRTGEVCTCTCTGDDGANGPVSNCACGCSSCVVGGITACTGAQLWPVTTSADVTPTGLTWAWEIAWHPSSPTTSTSLAQFDADVNHFKFRATGGYGVSGSGAVSQDWAIGCGDAQYGYYRDVLAPNGDTYKFDASGGLPYTTLGSYTFEATQSTVAGDTLAVVGTKAAYDLSVTTSLSSGTDGSISINVAPFVTLYAVVGLSRSGPATYYSSPFGPGPFPVGPKPHNGYLTNESFGAGAVPTTTGNVCSVSSIASVQDYATASQSITDHFVDGGLVIRSQSGGRVIGDTRVYPRQVLDISGTVSLGGGSVLTIGCRACARAFRVVLTRDSDGTVLVDQVLIQICNGDGWPYACSWGNSSGNALIRRGPTWWQLNGINLIGGECPDSISDVEADVVVDGSSTSSGLLKTTYTIAVTAALPPEDICCPCDDGSPCAPTCGSTCANAPCLTLTWHKDGGDLIGHVFQFSRTPCRYGDFGPDDSDNSIEFDPYDGIHQPRWLVTFFDEEDTGVHYHFYRACSDGIVGGYIPIDGASGTVTVSVSTTCAKCKSCEDGDSSKAVTWSTTGETNVATLTGTNPCEYGDGVWPVTFEAANGVHPDRHVVPITTDTDTFKYARNCDGTTDVDGTYTPIDGGSGTVHVG